MEISSGWNDTVDETGAGAERTSGEKVRPRDLWSQEAGEADLEGAGG